MVKEESEQKTLANSYSRDPGERLTQQQEDGSLIDGQVERRGEQSSLEWSVLKGGAHPVPLVPGQAGWFGGRGLENLLPAHVVWGECFEATGGERAFSRLWGEDLLQNTQLLLCGLRRLEAGLRRVRMRELRGFRQAWRPLWLIPDQTGQGWSC